MTREEFERRVVAGQGRLYRIARGYLRGAQDCLDAVSEAILKAWQNIGALRDDARFEPWLTRILIRECVNIQRRQKRVQPVETLPESAAPPAGNAALRNALDALPQNLRAATVLHYMEGYDVNTIAHLLRAPRGTVCGWLRQARGRLRDALKEEEQ